MNYVISEDGGDYKSLTGANDYYDGRFDYDDYDRDYGDYTPTRTGLRNRGARSHRYYNRPSASSMVHYQKVSAPTLTEEGKVGEEQTNFLDIQTWPHFFFRCS